MQGIFIECENIFRARTSTFQTSIDNTSLVSEMLQNFHLMSSYKLICYGVETKVPDEICFNILEKTHMLFTRVQSFSYAKDIREKYKSKKKQVKKSSLRTEIILFVYRSHDYIAYFLFIGHMTIYHTFVYRQHDFISYFLFIGHMTLYHTFCL